MGVEVKQTLERDYELVLPMKEIRALTMTKLSDIASGNSGGSADKTDSANSSKESKASSIERKTTSVNKGSQRFDPDHIMPQEVVVRMNEGKAHATPLFVIHPIEGAVISLQTVMSKIEGPVYGLQCTKEVPRTSVEEVATFYLQVSVFVVNH